MPYDALRSASPELLALLTWIAQHRDALDSATHLIGGPKALSRLGRLTGRLATADRMTSLLRRELDWLDRLLSLEDSALLTEAVADRIFLIAPDDPAVEEICLLTDGLRGVLAPLGPPPRLRLVA